MFGTMTNYLPHVLLGLVREGVNVSSNGEEGRGRWALDDFTSDGAGMVIRSVPSRGKEFHDKLHTLIVFLGNVCTSCGV